MSSFTLLGRRKPQSVTLDDIFRDAADIRFTSLLRLIFFIPWFFCYLMVSTIMSTMISRGRSILNSMLAAYTLCRLMIGFFLVIMFRLTERVVLSVQQLCDCFFTLRSQRETLLLSKLQSSKTYDEFEGIGMDLDRISSSIQKWKRTPNYIGDDFDYELLQLQLKTMRETKKKGEIEKIMSTISHVFRRTFCSLHNSNLYNQYCYIGTKHIIDDYFAELSECIHLIADPPTPNGVKPALSIKERIDFFFRAKRSLGRTALCLSGGGSLSMAHCGVIRALAAQGALPKVISGTSGGAILAGYLAVLTDEELTTDKIDQSFGYKLANKFGVCFLPTFYEQLFGAYRDRVLMDHNYFINAIKKYVGELTFQEAWLKTGRHVCISVSYSTKNKGNKQHAHHILLNHITSPDVYIWSAITASCALPGLMKPQQLWAAQRGRTGKKVAYYPDGIQWVDGSLQADIPIQKLQELFRVNYCIVSQVNPHVTPFLISAERSRSSNSFGLKVLEMLDDMASKTVNHQLDRLVKLKAIPAVYGHNFDRFAVQNFTGDCTIVPRIPLTLRFKILSHPTDQDMVEYISIGEQAAWPHLEHIKHVLKIENELDSVLRKMQMKVEEHRNGGCRSSSAPSCDPMLAAEDTQTV